MKRKPQVALKRVVACLNALNTALVSLALTLDPPKVVPAKRKTRKPRRRK